VNGKPLVTPRIGCARRRPLPDRWLATSGLVALFPMLAGCHIQVSQEVVLKPEKEAPITRAAARNELTVGLLPPRLVGLWGGEADPEAADVKKLGRAIADALEDSMVFKAVRFPLRDEKVDVLIEPKLRVSLAKNRLTNALKVFPGLVLPWIDGLGFDYDHRVLLEIVVKDATGATPIACDRFVAGFEMTAERYPSVLWWLGLHAGLLVLLVLESASTDQVVLEKLVEEDTGHAIALAIEWLAREFSPEAKACPDHPEAPNRGLKFCIYCRRNLWYPILNRRLAAAPGGTGPAAVTGTAR